MEQGNLQITQNTQPTLTVSVVQNLIPVITAQVVIGGGGTKIIFGDTMTGAGTPTDPVNVSDEILSEISDSASQIADIQSLIPTTASVTNQLADKEYVQSAILSLPKFTIQVVSELPSVGQELVLYLVPKDGDAPDVYDEYIWVPTTQTFELIGTTAVDLSGYLPTTGGTADGQYVFRLKLDSKYIVRRLFSFVPYLEDGTDLTEMTITLGNGYAYIGGSNYLTLHSTVRYLRPDADNVWKLGYSNYRWTNVYTTTINNGADIAIPTEGGTLARIEDIDAAVGDISTALTAILGE